jgi:hypothetical protein
MPANAAKRPIRSKAPNPKTKPPPKRKRPQSGAKPVAKPGRKPAPHRDVDTYWLQSRLKAANTTQKQLREKWSGKSAASVTRALHGSRDLSLAEFVALAHVLGCSADELLIRLGYEPTSPKIPISGAVIDGARVSYVSDRAGHLIPSPGLPSDVKALVCDVKDTGPLGAYAGALIFYRESERGKIPPSIQGELCVLEIAGEVTPIIGSIGRGTKARSTRVTRFMGADDPLDDPEILRASPVAAIHWPE